MSAATRLPLRVLLAQGEASDEPWLPAGVPAAALEAAPRLALTAEDAALDFGNQAADPCSLPQRRWGVVVPRERALHRPLLDALAPLLRHRAEQVGYAGTIELLANDVVLCDSEPDLSEADAHKWYHHCYKQEDEHELLRRDELERPDYLLLLGDLHQVPESIHRVLMQSGCFVGRLAFTRADGSPDLDAYRRYAEKLVAAERAPRRPGGAPVRALAVADGSAATELGARQLVRPLLERARLVGARFKTGDVNDPDACAVHDRDALWQTAAGLAGGLLMTVSHGYGGPRGGFTSGPAQRALQGAMSFLSGEPRLTAQDVAAQRLPFLRGGVWLMFACYSAGTPASSHYHRWLVQQRDALGSSADWVLDALPRPGGDFRPFIAALPQALLAREDGPVAFIGHLDLAWSYSFQTPGGTADPDLFRCLLGALLEQARVGAAFQFVQRKQRELEGSLLSTYHLQEDLKRRPDAAARLWTPARAQRLQELWMMRQDLAGFVLLGDPAAELSPRGA
jgi:hypothetical protein